jgi:DNA invertase Pin-like site-specific DNA recombinase
MIAVLGGLADVERDLIRTRTAEGPSRAQKRGQHMGRPPKLTEAQKAEARRRRAQGATLAELARSYDIAKSTISQLMTTRPRPARFGIRHSILQEKV